MIPNATRWAVPTRWAVKMGSTQDGMVWFDGKKINPNDARELGLALTLLASLAFAQKSQSVEILVLVAKSVSNRKVKA